MTLCIIPARGGSKRIARKNIRPFAGKPMLAHSIETALASGCFDRVLVSTDDGEIAAAAQAYGADVPFVRPSELADDYATTSDVMRHAVNALGVADDAPVCCLYATAPFVRSDDLRRGAAVLRESGADYAVSVTTFAFPIQRALRCEQGRLQMFQPENAAVRSQDLTEAWHDAGQFYWGRAAAWRTGKAVFAGEVCAVPVPRYRVQDIDTEEDWQRAEILWRVLAEWQAA
ncbi:pseudaminic acid cytidylyltransferase [Conchiformibius kuhniae]|uniref:Pseudaminic acid cytidylyltransferase n=1 Tax=Conchiformibius kuhniae TaxID=211502 RepID=A0A8T9MWD3_9NEIS|nr:pseudaminic acid cytidylyltransferase [Conchiformibius kuhniae]UOP04738.1 pseudaminic acid cytidylyltransferase [Conchiformibius kuhniae]